VQNNLRYLDEIDRKQLLRYVKFLRDHESDLDDRTVQNVFEKLNTFLRTRDIFTAGKILAELDYAERPPKPYTKQELKNMFAVMDEDERLFYGLFLNCGIRDAEMQLQQVADPKPHSVTDRAGDRLSCPERTLPVERFSGFSPKKCTYTLSAHMVPGGTCARRRDAAHGAVVLRVAYGAPDYYDSILSKLISARESP
jgi:hypothetical protein